MNGNISKFGTTIVALTALAVLTTATPAMAAKPVGGSRPTSAVVAVLEFDGDWTSDTLSHIPIVPTVCQTGEHLAGPSEVAIATMNGFVAPSGQSNDFIQLKVAISEDGWPFEQVPGMPSIDALIGGAGQVSITKRIELLEGSTYVFGARFSSGSPVTDGFSTCHGTVTVVRLVP